MNTSSRFSLGHALSYIVQTPAQKAKKKQGDERRKARAAQRRANDKRAQEAAKATMKEAGDRANSAEADLGKQEKELEKENKDLSPEKNAPLLKYAAADCDAGRIEEVRAVPQP